MRSCSAARGSASRRPIPTSRFTSRRVRGRSPGTAAPASTKIAADVLSGMQRDAAGRAAAAGADLQPAEGEDLDGKLRRLEERPDCRLRVEAGVSHSQLAKFCIERGLAGLEFGCGIPGTVGGWLAMNAGIPGREVKDVVEEIEVISPTGRALRHFPRAELRFVYRALRGLAPGSLILSALFNVSLSDTDAVRAEVDRLLTARRNSQPLDVPSCGSVFKNPPGDFAGRLIEAAGLKGRRLGGAEISPVHANFIANRGGATAADVLGLIREAQAAVWQTAAVRLVPEVRLIGGKP